MPTEKTSKPQATIESKHKAPQESVAEMKAKTNQDREGKFEYRYPRESNEAHQWRCLKRNMRHDERLDRAAALRLLNKALELPTGSPRDKDELRAEFYERFGKEQQSSPKLGNGEVRDDDD